MLWAITAYFNPAQYQSRRRNYLEFAAALRRQKVPLFTVEIAFGEADFNLPPGPHLLQIRTADPMWQKERALNIALAELPPQCDHAAWLDSDLIFHNDTWALEAERLLERHPLVQPFAEVHQNGWVYANFPWGCRHAPPGSPIAGGFAWAGRLSLLREHGLYDASILGGGDKLISTAMIDRKPTQGVDNPRPLPLTAAHWQHYQAWKDPFFRDVQGDLGFVPGKAVHMDHGTRANRFYWDRYLWLAEHQFDPFRDIAIGPDRCWHWNSNKPALHAAAREYFEIRREDEVAHSQTG